ncbi:hypothetical protein D3C78_1989080 [compost metagenome]
MEHGKIVEIIRQSERGADSQLIINLCTLVPKLLIVQIGQQLKICYKGAIGCIPFSELRHVAPT